MLSEPGEILEWFNRELLDQNIDKHVAVIMAVGDLQLNSVTLANAGHFPPAILVDASGDRPLADFVEQKGKPVGLFDKVSYDARTVELAAGDRLIIFSDGVLDALKDMNLTQKEELLLEAAASNDDMDGIWRSLGIDPEGRTPDDMTCLIVRRTS